MDFKAEGRRRYQKIHNDSLLGQRVINCLAVENKAEPAMREYFIQDRAMRAKVLARRI